MQPMLSHRVGMKGGANKDRTCLFRYIGVQRVARISTGKSHAFAILHREIHFKFGSVGCSGEWSSGEWLTVIKSHFNLSEKKKNQLLD